ncbi:MAG: hypothetical protein A2X94_07465 [Bdellovibrionales bacterium GWB1_55_8]|nr:MAG: hypothetical protein A2X94_07465 [Bdellovibrionales bacterium GWB1_55_8]
MADERTLTKIPSLNTGDDSGFDREEPTDPGITLPPMKPSQKRPPVIPTPAPAMPKPPLVGRMPDMAALDALMKDPSITEIMVNDIRNVMVEKDGKMSFSGFAFRSIDELNRLTRNILDVTGRILSPDSPYVDVILADGSRVNIIGPPLTLHGPCLTIRKFPSKRFMMEDLIGHHMVDRRVAHFLSFCVVGRLNVLISGGTGSGKTTLMNALIGFVPKNERLVTIEDTPELVVGHANSVQLQTKPQTPTLPPVLARDLVANALRMRPDRIIVGEGRRGEAFDMLQAMNTGHSGSMTTVHANSPRDALARLETLCLMGGVDLPLIAVRKQIASAIDVIIQLKRLRNGRRHVVQISEVTGMEAETFTLQDIFGFEVGAKAAPGDAMNASFPATGLVPTFVDRLREIGLDFPPNYFG